MRARPDVILLSTDSLTCAFSKDKLITVMVSQFKDHAVNKVDLQRRYGLIVARKHSMATIKLPCR